MVVRGAVSDADDAGGSATGAPRAGAVYALRYVIRYGIARLACHAQRPAAVKRGLPAAATLGVSARCFETLAQDLRALSRMASGRAPDPTAAIIDSRALRSTPESGTRAEYDGAKRKRGSKVHLAVNTLGHLLALHMTAANVGDRAAVSRRESYSGQLLIQTNYLRLKPVEFALVPVLGL